MVPDIFARFHWYIYTRPLHHYYVLDAGGVGRSLIHVGLEGQRLAAPEETVSGNYYLGLGIEDPAVQAT